MAKPKSTQQQQKVSLVRSSAAEYLSFVAANGESSVEAMYADYDVTAQATKRFFATVQNKLHWAIHGQTAAELHTEKGEE